jgi:hypothetical protein
MLQAVRAPRSPAHAGAAALAVLKRVPAVVASGLRQQFVRLYAAGRKAALATVRGARLREEVDPDPLDLLPAPARNEVLRLLDQFVRPQDFALIGTDTDRCMPDVLAHLLATSISAGDTQAETAQKLRPFFDGSRVRAKRAARTFGLHVAHSGQMSAWEELGDAVIGYELLSVRGENTRPWHAARHGRVYYRDPGAGQSGYDKMPRPPLEPPDIGERPAGTPRIGWN